MAVKWWLLLEKSDQTRVSQGIDGYRDETGRSYHYDSLVPNHKRLEAGDMVVIRKEDQIIGTGRIDSISVPKAIKTHRRCPSCMSTDIRERLTRQPKWKYGRCANEFKQPKETKAPVDSFLATIKGLKAAPSVRELKACAFSGNGEKLQNSMIELDPNKLARLAGFPMT